MFGGLGTCLVDSEQARGGFASRIAPDRLPDWGVSICGLSDLPLPRAEEGSWFAPAWCVLSHRRPAAGTAVARTHVRLT